MGAWLSLRSLPQINAHAQPFFSPAPRTISKRSSECWLLIGHKKMLCIIVPNRRTASPELFSRVCTQLHGQLLVHHACSCKGNFHFLFPNQKRRNYPDESKKRFGCYQQDQFNLQSQKSNSLTWQNKLKKKKHRGLFLHFFAVTARVPRENA